MPRRRFPHYFQNPRAQAVLVFAGLGLLVTLVRSLVLPLNDRDPLPLFSPLPLGLRLGLVVLSMAGVLWGIRPCQRSRGELALLILMGAGFTVGAVWLDRPADVLMVVPMVVRYWCTSRQTVGVFAVLAFVSLGIYLLIPPVATFQSLHEWIGLLQETVMTLLEGGFAYAAFELMLRRNRERQLLNQTLAKLEAAQGAQLSSVALEERAHLSRELHDTIGHHMTALNFQLQRARLLAQASPEPLQDALQQAHQRGQEVMESLQAVVRTLRSPQEFQLFPALQALADQWPGEVQLQLPAAEPPLPASHSLVVYRFCQEALTNALKHAPGQPVTLQVQESPPSGAPQLQVCVRNPLTPDRPTSPLISSPSGGHGLPGLRQRLASLGGQLTLSPTHEEYRICLTLPLT